jgi:hypothetical protein
MIAGAAGVQSVYDYWLGMLPQFFAQLGAAVPAVGHADGSATSTLPFPADQVAKAATLTNDALQSIAQTYSPLLQAAGAPGLLAQWAAAMPLMTSLQPKPEQPAATTMAMAFAPWMGTMPFTPPAAAGAGGAAPAAVTAALLPFQQMQKAWLELGSQMVGGTSQTYATAFDRTFGALSDALGLGPVRKLQAAGQQIMAAAVAQNEARAAYAMLVQTAFASGLDNLLQRLAEMGQKGERVDSVLVLLRMWAVATEQAVHQVLQSERGLVATAAVARAGLGYRRQLQGFAAIIADTLDMATRRDLDDAYCEIQELKRELRALRSAPAVHDRAPKPRARRAKGTTK